MEGGASHMFRRQWECLYKAVMHIHTNEGKQGKTVDGIVCLKYSWQCIIISQLRTSLHHHYYVINTIINIRWKQQSPDWRSRWTHKVAYPSQPSGMSSQIISHWNKRLRRDLFMQRITCYTSQCHPQVETVNNLYSVEEGPIFEMEWTPSIQSSLILLVDLPPSLSLT
jgi:hypothetical protein